MATPTWFETHAHLSDPKFDPDRDETIERAFQGPVGTIIEIADGPEEWEKAKTLSHKYAGQIYWAAGIHPYFAEHGTPESFQKLKSFSKEKNFVAIGEVGLDYFKCEVPPETQKKTFSTAIELALEIQKPLIIHCRNAYPDLLPILRQYFEKSSSNETASPGVIHCFSGDRKDAEAVIGLGFYVGVDGPLTYPNAHDLRETFKTIPLEKIVLETDSPYLPPQSYRGKRNEPSYLPHIGKALADLKNLSQEELSKTLLQNSEKLFRLK